MVLPIFGEAPFEFEKNSEERKEMLEMLKPEVARQAGLKPEEVKLEGSLKVQGKWAFFVGKAVDAQSETLKLEPYGKGDTCALYLDTKKGWAMVDWSIGYQDLIYSAWASTYRLNIELLGLPSYLNPQ